MNIHLNGWVTGHEGYVHRRRQLAPDGRSRQKRVIVRGVAIQID